MKRSLLLAATLLAAVGSAFAQDWAKARIEKSPRHLEWVTVKHDGREVGCYVGYPEVKDKATAVIVIHEIYGLSDWARSVCDELAEAGYIAIAPDLLWGLGAKGGGTAELDSTQIGQKIRTLSPEQITADLNAAADYVTKLDACNGKLAVIGFCWGGSQSFNYATNNRSLKAAFVCYGSGPTDAAVIARIAAPVYGFYGGNDARVTATTAKSAELMKAAGKTFEPKVYDGAGHGFMRAGEAPAPDAAAEQKTRDAFAANKQAHDAAWARVKEVLGKL
jgi:carboxymethylenebutenolidase